MTKEKIKKELEWIYENGSRAEAVGIYTNELATEILRAVKKVIRKIK